jgi:hypothetical protein
VRLRVPSTLFILIEAGNDLSHTGRRRVVVMFTVNETAEVLF